MRHGDGDERNCAHAGAPAFAGATSYTRFIDTDTFGPFLMV